MCIAIFKPRDKVISKETLEQCFKTNSDGAGFIFKEDGKLKIKKGYFSFESFYHEYKKVESQQLLIHFRIKTHGKVSQENCHPFYVTKDLGFIHNGIISHHSGDLNTSDTRDFNVKILKPLVKKLGTTIIQNEEMKTILGNYIGYSKLVFMDVEENVTIINENLGNWNDEIWYSNFSWRIPEPINYSNSWDTNRSKAKYQEEPEYYIEKELNNKSTRINQGDYCIIGKNAKNIIEGLRVKVIYINRYAFCDIALPNGIILQGIPGSVLTLEKPNLLSAPLNEYWDDENKKDIEHGFLGI
jgi:predicted glutamine amidotransferase